MPPFKFTFAKGRMLGEVNHRLGDVIARLGDDQLAEFFDFFFVGLGPHQHAVAPGVIGRLPPQLRQVLENVFFILFLAGQIGWHIGQDGLLVKVIFNHAGHEIIHDLVIGDAGADGIG